MSGIKVFLVEDKSDIAASLTAVLEACVGVEVVAVVTGEQEALAWLEAGGVCEVMIVDLFLASGTGMGVLKALHSNPMAPIRLVVTNHADASVRLRCTALGAEAVFDKAREIDALISWFIERLERRAAIHVS